MNAGELMLDDWIRHIDEMEPGQVYELRDDFIEIDIDLSQEGQEGQECWIDGDPDDFEGIPLTEEMLKLNGWDKYPFQCYLSNKKVIEFCLRNAGIGFYCSNENGENDIVNIHYVHELQHLLRIFGYGDLADNFKIK